MPTNDNAAYLTFPFEDVEPQFRLFAHSMPNQVWAAKADGLLYWISDNALAYAGLPHDQLIGTGWTTIVHPDDLTAAIPAWSNAIQSEKQYETEFRLRRADGVYRWFLARAVPVRDPSGRVAGWVGSNTDIDELRGLSDRLVEAQTELQTILNSAGSAFYSVDTEGHTMLCNNEFLRLLGYDDDSEVLTRKLHGEIHHTHADGTPHPVEECPIYLCASTGVEAHVRSDVFFRRDGIPIPVEYWVRPVQRGGKHIGAICTFNDIGERIRLEEQRTLLFHELNHRVKNAFALMSGLVALTARAATTPKDMSTALQGRLGALSRAHELVQPGLRTGDFLHGRGVKLAQLLAEILAPYAAVDADRRISIDGPSIDISAEALTSCALVLHELTTNAAKYGALAKTVGHLNVVWSKNGMDCRIVWTETGGPPIGDAPTSKGFGGVLVRRTVEQQLGGQLDYSWRPEGLQATLILPLSKLSAG